MSSTRKIISRKMLTSSNSLPKSDVGYESWSRAPRTFSIESAVNPRFTYFGGGNINTLSIIVRKMKYGLDIRCLEKQTGLNSRGFDHFNEKSIGSSSSTNKRGNYIYQVTLIPEISLEITDKSSSDDDISRRKSFDLPTINRELYKHSDNFLSPCQGSRRDPGCFTNKAGATNPIDDNSKLSKPSHKKHNKSGSISKAIKYIRTIRTPKKKKIKTSLSASKLDFNVKLIRTYCNDSELKNTSECTFPLWLWNSMILTIRYFLPLLKEFDQVVEEFFSVIKIDSVIKYPRIKSRGQKLLAFKQNEKISWKEALKIELATNIKLSKASQIVRPLSSPNQENNHRHAATTSDSTAAGIFSPSPIVDSVGLHHSRRVARIDPVVENECEPLLHSASCCTLHS